MHVTTIMSLYQPDQGYLAAQLESIARQDVDPATLDVLVRNDYPAGEDLGDFCRDHCPGIELRYVHGEQNLGYAASFEWLVAHAAPTCDALALCDQDDLWRPDRVRKAVAQLDAGALACACDRSIIDSAGQVVLESWRVAHAAEPDCQWHTGDRFVSQAVFTTMAPGMALMVRSDAALSLLPFLPQAAHDTWLLCGCNILGSCAFVDEPLVQYRRHGHNVSGVLQGVSCKRDWYETRVDVQLAIACELRRRFPDCDELDEALAWARARKERDLAGIWRYRHLGPQLATFELALALTPDSLFRMALRLLPR